MSSRFAASLSERSPEAAVEELLEISSRYHTIDFDLGDLGSRSESNDAFLGKLVELRLERHYHFSFACELKPPVTRECARLLRDAGVTQARISPQLPDDKRPSVTRSGHELLDHLQLLKSLEEAEIGVYWTAGTFLCAKDLMNGKKTVQLINGIHHLPPPMKNGSLLSNDSELKLLEPALFNWMNAYSPTTLTYSRGPGFVSILDQRKLVSRSTELTLTLRGLQAEIFLFCSDIKSFSEIAARFGDRARTDQLRAFLEAMQERLLICTQNNSFLSLALHRKLVEN